MSETNDNVKVNVDPARVEPGEDAYLPLVDIYETSDGTTVLLAEVPGATQESIDIRVDKGVLSISADGRRLGHGQEYRAVYTGFAGGQYFRAFALSDEVDRDRIDATLDNGLLTVTLPRAAAASTRKIDIREG
jgi:HSP20 family molecular chaperone IbpA